MPRCIRLVIGIRWIRTKWNHAHIQCSPGLFFDKNQPGDEASCAPDEWGSGLPSICIAGIPQSFNMSFIALRNTPLDVYFLLDVSASLQPTLLTLQQNLQQICKSHDMWCVTVKPWFCWVKFLFQASFVILFSFRNLSHVLEVACLLSTATF